MQVGCAERFEILLDDQAIPCAEQGKFRVAGEDLDAAVVPPDHPSRLARDRTPDRFAQRGLHRDRPRRVDPRRLLPEQQPDTVSVPHADDRLGSLREADQPFAYLQQRSRLRSFRVGAVTAVETRDRLDQLPRGFRLVEQIHAFLLESDPVEQQGHQRQDAEAEDRQEACRDEQSVPDLSLGLYLVGPGDGGVECSAQSPCQNERDPQDDQQDGRGDPLPARDDRGRGRVVPTQVDALELRRVDELFEDVVEPRQQVATFRGHQEPAIDMNQRWPGVAYPGAREAGSHEVLDDRFGPDDQVDLVSMEGLQRGHVALEFARRLSRVRRHLRGGDIRRDHADEIQGQLVERRYRRGLFSGEQQHPNRLVGHREMAQVTARLADADVGEQVDVSAAHGFERLVPGIEHAIGDVEAGAPGELVHEVDGKSGHLVVHGHVVGCKPAHDPGDDPVLPGRR